MVKHIANINNYTVSIDSDGTLNAPGLESGVIKHPTEGYGPQGSYLVSDGLGGWSWSSPTLAEGSRDIEPFSISSIGGLFTMINSTGYYTMFHNHIDAEFSRISLYTQSNTSNASGTIVAGVFSNSSHYPTTSLSQATHTFNNVNEVQEIIVDFNTIHLSSNNKYWIGIAVNTTGGTFHLAKSSIGSTDNSFTLAESNMLSSNNTLSAPTTGSATRSHFNFYYRLHNPNGASGPQSLITQDPINQNVEIAEHLIVYGNTFLNTAKIGVINSAAAFANNAHFDIDSYALRQTNSGDTVINTVNGKKIFFRVDNDGNKEMTFDGSKLLLPGRGKIEINQGGYGCYLWGGKYASNQNKDEAILATPNGNHFLRFIDHRGSGSFNQQIMIGRSGSHNQLYIFGVYFYQSDDRLKHQEVHIENGLDLIRQLQPQKYKKTSEKKDADYVGELEDNSWKWESGLIAQDVAKIPDLSHCVQYNSEEDLYFLNYNDIFATNVAATKELDKIVQSHKAEIDSFTTRLTALDSIVQTQQTEINELKSFVYEGDDYEKLWSVDYNSIHSYHIKATQELHSLVQTLQAENTLLKSKLNELLTEAGKETI